MEVTTYERVKAMVPQFMEYHKYEHVMVEEADVGKTMRALNILDIGTMPVCCKCCSTCGERAHYHFICKVPGSISTRTRKRKAAGIPRESLRIKKIVSPHHMLSIALYLLKKKGSGKNGIGGTSACTRTANGTEYPATNTTFISKKLAQRISNRLQEEFPELSVLAESEQAGLDRLEIIRANVNNKRACAKHDANVHAFQIIDCVARGVSPHVDRFW